MAHGKASALATAQTVNKGQSSSSGKTIAPASKSRSDVKQASWRDVLPVHPAAELFPLMAETDPTALKELGDDIIKNGLTSPIVLWRADPKSPTACLLDGRNRLDAIELAIGNPVEVGAPSLMAGEFLATNKVIVLDKAVEPYAYVISANIHRCRQ